MDVEKIMDEVLEERVCCSEAMVRFGLKLRGEENEQFANAASALCSGLKNGALCGCLTGAAMMLTMFDKQASSALITELFCWFDEEYGDRYGSVNCEDILTDRSQMWTLCPVIMKATAEKCVEILKDHDLLQEEKWRNER